MINIEQITRWSILAAGILAAVCGLVMTARAKPSGEKPKIAHGFFIWPNTLSAILAVLIIITTAFVINSPISIVISLAVGWALLFSLFFASRAAGRKLAADGGGSEDQSKVGYDLLSASGFLSSATALLGVGIILIIHPHTAMTTGPLLTLALGFWIAATLWSLPSSLYRGLLEQEADDEPIQIAPLCVQFRSASGEIAFLTVAGLTVAAAIAGFRFPKENIFGSLYPIAVFAASLIFGILISPLLSPTSAHSGISRDRIILRWFAVIAFIVGTGMVAYSLSVYMLNDIRAFYCFGIGLSTAMLLMLTARYRPPFANIGSHFGIEIAVAEVLMVLASAMLAFRWMAGYGIALCGVGLLSTLAVLFPIGALWAARSAGEDSGEVDLPFMAHAASRFAEIVMASGAFLIVVALLRLFSERAALGRTGIDITDPYPLIGMIIGGSFPIIIRALSQSGNGNHQAFSFDRSVLSKLGKQAAQRTLGIWLIAVITPLLIAFFWRTEAAGAFLVGLAVSELFLILALWLGEVRNTADEGIRLTTRSTHILAVGSGLVTVLLVPLVAQFTESLSKTIRFGGLAVVFILLLIWVVINIRRRLRTEGD